MYSKVISAPSSASQKYPCLKRIRGDRGDLDDVIVLFTGPNTGVSLRGKTGMGDVGTFSQSWGEAIFEPLPLNEAVVLQN